MELSVIENKDFTTAKVLIMECTFLEDISVEEAHSCFHVHISEIIQHSHLFENNSIILTHFSDRYNSTHVIRELSAINAPTTFKDKLYLLLDNSIHKIT